MLCLGRPPQDHETNLILSVLLRLLLVRALVGTRHGIEARKYYKPISQVVQVRTDDFYLSSLFRQILALAVLRFHPNVSQLEQQLERT